MLGSSSRRSKVSPMRPFGQMTITWSTQLLAAATLAMPQAAPGSAAAHGARRARAASHDAVDHGISTHRAAPIFHPLSEEPAPRIHEPQVDWQLLAMHYRPVA
jgi:hypothetical protein